MFEKLSAYEEWPSKVTRNPLQYVPIVYIPMAS